MCLKLNFVVPEQISNLATLATAFVITTRPVTPARRLSLVGFRSTIPSEKIDKIFPMVLNAFLLLLITAASALPRVFPLFLEIGVLNAWILSLPLKVVTPSVKAGASAATLTRTRRLLVPEKTLSLLKQALLILPGQFITATITLDRVAIVVGALYYIVFLEIIVLVSSPA